MPVKVIINPIAGQGRAVRVWSEIEPLLKDRSVDHEAVFTTAPRHAVDLAAGCADRGFDTVAVIAGDGTIHEAVNGLVDTGAKLCVIPGGRGNDLARTMGIPREPRAAAALLWAGRTSRIDLGRANGEYFFNVAGVGFDAEVAAAVNRGRVFVNGMVTYLVYVLKMLASYQPVEAYLTLDGRAWSQKVFMAAVGNGQYLGGGMKLAPSADPQDGLFDVVVAGDLTRPEAIQALARVYSGSHVHLPKVQTYRGRSLTIDAGHPLNVEADGEVIGRVPVTFEVAPAALSLLVPVGS
ncbi:MAG: diacylglycerol kinase family protein [Bacillota bacterium]